MTGEPARIDLDAEFESTHVQEVFDEVEQELIGLEPVKTRIRQIAALLMVERVRAKLGISSDRPTLHMSFTGNPGTGKTTVAQEMAKILYRLSYVRRPEVVSVTRDDLVGQYIGHTGPKTRDVIKKAMGGVLFIDEAYTMFRPDNERDYGQEAIEILLQVMENHRDDLVVILAGYRDRMKKFYESNPGVRSRIAHHLDFPDYQPDELMAIAKLMLSKQQYGFSSAAEAAFVEYIERRMRQPQFANARSIRNALDRARLRQANRLFLAGGTVSKTDLMTLEPPDIRSSRVFTEPVPNDAATAG